MNPIFSVITINFNNLEGLKKTVASVVEQSFPFYEYIIIDGGSTDGSRDFIEAHSDKITYWVSEPDNGIYHAMNKGILRSNGQFLQFLNSGDWLYDQRVLEQVSAELDGQDIVLGDVAKVKNDGEVYFEHGALEKEITLKTFIRGSICHGATFINRNLFKKYGNFDENLKIVSDWKFFLIALGMNNSTIKFIDLNILYFDITGISNTNVHLREKERIRVLQEIIPKPIYVDYMELLNSNINFRSKKFKMMSELENNATAKKINFLMNKVLLKIFTGKNINDLK